MTELTPKERLLNSIVGKPVDRIPWSPFLAYYWQYVPREVQKKGQLAYLKEMNADPLLRGFEEVCHPIYNNCELRDIRTPTKRYHSYETPVGTLTWEQSFSSAGDTWFVTKHPVSTEEDFKVLQYIYEHMEMQESLINLEKEYNKIGDDGLLLPTVGARSKTCFQDLVEFWVGTVELTYALMDFPETVEECLQVMRQRDLDTVRIAAKSCADGFIFWEDSSTTNISPAMFEDYTLPIIKEWGDELHKSGKLLVHHACGHLRHLAPLIATSGIDALESISPPPTGNIELFDIRDALPPEIALIGGIEPTRLLNFSMEELESHVREIISHMKGTRYVLGNSDSCPPYVEEEKFRMVSRLVREMA